MIKMGRIKYILKNIIYSLLPPGTNRNIIARALYRGIIKKEVLILLKQKDYEDILSELKIEIAKHAECRDKLESEITKHAECRDKLESEIVKHTEVRDYLTDTYNMSYDKSPDYVPYEKINFTLQKDDPQLIAFYLPQYHPFPENDKYFGKNFTEWINTTRAKPLFKGHYQPRLPNEMGFYDTRIKDVLQNQIEIARAYGIYGFCFHHYWFSGKPMMRVPYNHIISNPELDIPFCLNWANESWTIRWDGFDTKNGILLKQEHSPEDDIAFIKDIEPALRDKRYIRINGRPLLIIYQPGRFLDMRATVDRWNDYTTKQGLGQLYLAAIQTNFEGKIDPINNTVVHVDPGKYNFDAAIEFPHHGYLFLSIAEWMDLFYKNFSGQIFKYDNIIDKCLAREKPDYTLFRGIMPGWDNTARNKNPIIFIDSSPKLYRKWLDGIMDYTTNNLSPEKQFIFINAWNEWAEGAYLEPDRKYGYAYLNATRQALLGARKKN